MPVRKLGSQGLQVRLHSKSRDDPLLLPQPHLPPTHTHTSTPAHTQIMQAAAQGLGCMGMSAFYKDPQGGHTDEESIATIHRAKDLGVTFLGGCGLMQCLQGRAECTECTMHQGWTRQKAPCLNNAHAFSLTMHCIAQHCVTYLNIADTSDVYGPFTNEELVGRAIKGVSGSGGSGGLC